MCKFNLTEEADDCHLFYLQLYGKILTFTVYHIENTGVIVYEYKGHSIDGNNAKLCFLNHGEASNILSGKHLAYYMLPDTQLIKPDECFSLHNFRGSAVFCSATLPSKFHFARCFCAPGSMSKKMDGFIIDLRYFKYLPKSVEICFITDRNIYHEDAYYLKRDGNVFRYLFGRPFYPINRNSPSKVIRPIYDAEYIDSLTKGVEFHGNTWDSLSVYVDTFFISDSNKIILLSYNVANPIINNKK